MRGSVEEAFLKVCLEFLDASAESGLCDSMLPGSTGETSEPIEGFEMLKLADLDGLLTLFISS